MTDVTPCVLYAAKSTEDVHGSIPTQLDDCRELAEREGWTVVEEFQDEGFSAYSGNRGPGLVAAKAAAAQAAEEYDTTARLVVQHTDRLARGAGDEPGAADHLGELFFQLKRQRVQVERVQGGPLTDPIYAVLEGQRNTEDSERKSAAVAAGKDRQMERGERLGGPVPDGLLLRVERDASDRVVGRHYERDPERAPILERAFALSEEGYGDTAVAQRLNAEGHRTKNGRPWSRRRVQDTLLNQIYAGRAVRRGRGGSAAYRRLDEPEVTVAVNVEVLIEPDRYDRITAARASRDRVAARGKDGLRKGDRGRPTRRYALAKLAVCDRCGERMYARTTPYVRKDGTQQRHYQCANVQTATGLCDQPRIDAELVDAALIEYLDRLFVDVDAWAAELNSAADAQRQVAQAALDSALAELDRLDGLASKVEADYLRQVEKGDEDVAEFVARMVTRTKGEREDAERVVALRREELAAVPTGEENVDATLDLYNDLRAAVTGGDGSLGDLNARLRAEFDEFRIDRVDEDTVGVVPVLRRREPIDAGALYKAWEEAGQPDPTEEQVAEYEAAIRAEDPIWLGTRPPAVPLSVVAPTQRGSDAQL